MKIDQFENAPASSASTVVATTSDTNCSSNKKEAEGAKIQMVKNPEQPKNKPKIKPKEVKSIKATTGQIKKPVVKKTSSTSSTSPVAKKISKKNNLGKENSSNNKNKVKVPFDFKAQKQKRLSPALAVICGKKTS